MSEHPDTKNVLGTGASDDALLDNPVWHALTGPQAYAAERAGLAARFQIELSVFAALADAGGEQAWADATQLPGAQMVFVQPPTRPPGIWEIHQQIPAVQMVAPDMEGEPDEEAKALGPADVPDMLALIARTGPGPFLPRTIELGTYIGVRREGMLVAMAGERMRVPGWTEVSAVCTDQSLRGSGMATRLVLAVVAGIRSRGDRAMLHVASHNETAIRLYRRLGFVERREIDFMLVGVALPTGAEAAAP